MKTLNLTDIDKSDVKYQIQEFPDGQNNIVIEPSKLVTKTETFWATPGNHSAFNSQTKHKYNLVESNPVQIKSRLNNWLDLELIVCVTKSLRNLGVKEIHLYTPYFMGARSDRQFEHGGNRYIKDVIAPVINSLNFESVTCIDPHSYVLENCVNNFKSITNVELVKNSLRLIAGDWKERTNNEGFVLVSPDAGASHKIFKLAEQIGYKGDIITCSKERDKDGKIIGTNVPISRKQHEMLHKGPYKDFIIIDDICDGGATFINIAQELKKYFHESGKTESKIYLIVTHGIFSKGFRELSEHFENIYCTNSYSNVSVGPGFVKQLNVF
jgi:ribose-phosphate pyrophosphokinase